MSPFDNVRTIEFPKICDPRGNLTFIEGGCHVPFPIKRVFYIYDVPGGASRGAHAHKTCTEVLIALSGSLDVHLFDGCEEKIFTLRSSNKGIIVPPGLWLSTHAYTTGTICLVLCSDYYEEEDYIRDIEDFMAYAESRGIATGICPPSLKTEKFL